MAADLHTSPAAIANLLTVFALTFALAAPLSQVVLGQLPRRTLLLGGLVVMSAGFHRRRIGLELRLSCRHAGW